MTAPLLLDDGTPATAGMRVWRVHVGYASIARATVRPHWLTMWRDSLAGRLFSTERAAVAFALREARQRLTKARKESRHEARVIARLKERLREAPP